MSKQSNKKQEQEKKQTRYDRKMEARRKQAEKEKRNALIGKIIVIVILVGIIGTAGYFLADHYISAYKAKNDTYLSVGDHEITQLEYEYYYNSTVNNYLNTYSYFLAYMGLDTSLPYDEQDYSDDMTWQDYFEQMAVEQLKQEYALVDDAEATGFEYDTSEEYEEYLTSAKEDADENSLSLRAYLKSSFGEYATKENIKPFMEHTLIASAYYNQLVEDNTPSDDEINTYYEENQNSYDTVTFYSFSFDESNYTEDAEVEDSEDTDTEYADTVEDTENEDSENTDAEDDTEAEDSEDTNTEDDTETDDSEDTDATEALTAYDDAQEMADRLEAGEDFESLCYEYATDDMKDYYNDEDSEYSLTSSVTADSINSLYEDWLYDESRQAGDITIISDEDAGVYYVLMFVIREYDDTCLDTISSTLASNATSEYLQGLTDAYEVTDIKGEIGYLSTEDAQDEDEEEDSLLNTDIIE